MSFLGHVQESRSREDSSNLGKLTTREIGTEKCSHISKYKFIFLESSHSVTLTQVCRNTWRLQANNRQSFNPNMVKTLNVHHMYFFVIQEYFHVFPIKCIFAYRSNVIREIHIIMRCVFYGEDAFSYLLYLSPS